MGLIGVSFTNIFVILIPGLVNILCKLAQGKSNLCDTRQFAKPAFNESGAYWKCEPFPTSPQTGVWRLVRCKKNEAFSKVDQICKPRSTIRRQQSLCQMQPNLPMCQEQNCGASNYNPALGGQCSWTNAGLMPTSSSSLNFMQCTPSSVGSACGTWNQMQCASGTSFNPVFQVCVVQQSMCSPTNVAVCPCGVANACPPPCTCVNGVCCYPGGDHTSTPPPTVGPQFYTTPYTNLPPIYPQLPMCPNGQRALNSCYQDSNCQPGLYCRDGGCCPLPQCPNGQTAMQACDDVGRNCTIDYVCRDIITCPNGQTATQACNSTNVINTCMPDYVCYKDACCMNNTAPVCPDGNVSSSVCVGTGQANCPPSFVCMNGGCCLAPRCPSGELALQSCSGYGNECPNGYSCQNGACCRMLMCPNGQSATQSCDASHQCMPGYSCQNGACCLQPMCPNGQPSSQVMKTIYFDLFATCAFKNLRRYVLAPMARTCSGYGQSNCPPGHSCQNGACCPLPACPNGLPASQMCSGYGQSNCPPNFSCQNGGCCPQPMCPGGQPSMSEMRSI
uniref:Uncharacterized protein n=1 Tax=Romanomermis culicivorax TaxID=13658 RepID=A0A915KD67_ROMCU